MATLVEIATEPATIELGWMGLPNDMQSNWHSLFLPESILRYFPLHPLKEINPKHGGFLQLQ